MKFLNLISLTASIYLTLTRTLGLCGDLTFQLNGDSVIRLSTLCTGIVGIVTLLEFGQNLAIDLQAKMVEIQDHSSRIFHTNTTIGFSMPNLKLTH